MKFFFAAVLIAASVWAQEPTAPDSTPQGQEAGAQPASQPQEETYGGPTVPSRGGAPSTARGEEAPRLRPFLAVMGIYDGGLGTVSVNAQGQVPYHEAYGVEAAFGVTGTRTWRHSVLDLDYHGAFRHYNQNSYYDGMDNSLGLNFEHDVSRRVKLVFNENGGLSRRGMSMPIGSLYSSGIQNYNAAYSGLTSNDLFDSPTATIMSSGRMIYQPTLRTSFSIGGTGFTVRRQARELIGVIGYAASGDVAYRLSRYQTIAIDYSFSHFEFANQYGQSDVHGAGFNYSVRIGRRWEFGLGAGAARAESLRNIQVQLDPLIALILGRSFGLSKFHGVVYLPRVGAHLSRSSRRTSLSFSYDRSVIAGNGVYTTAAYESGNIGLNYTGIRRLSLQMGAGYSRYSALIQDLGRYRNFMASWGFSYRLARGLSLVGRADGRRYYVAGSDLTRMYGRAQFGFSWSPGEYPLALW